MTSSPGESGPVLAAETPSLHPLEIARLDAADWRSYVARAPYAELITVTEAFVDHLRALDWHARLDAATTVDLRQVLARFESPAAAAAALHEIEIELVFTSHPSEVRPFGVLRCLRAVDGAADIVQIEEALQLQGGRIRTGRPTVVEEVDALAELAAAVILPGLRDHATRLAHAARESGITAELLPPALRLHTWVGADRDGNPFVDAHATLEAGRKYRQAAIAAYRVWLGELQRLDPADVMAGHVRTLHDLLDDVHAGGADITAFAAGVVPAVQKLAPGALHESWNAMLAVMQRCGLHTFTLEWRENASVIAAADHETARAARIEDDELTPATRDLLSSLRALARIRRDNGPAAVGALIISNTEDESVITALARLAVACGVFDDGEIPVVPLLESIDALRRAGHVAETMCIARGWRRGDAAGARRLQMMVGYSDAAKDGGRLEADQMIRRAQTEIAAVCAAYGATPHIFHGRGGTPARGDASIAESFAEIPKALPAGVLKQTEQGEVVANRYGHPKLAAHAFDQWVACALEHRRAPAAAEFSASAPALLEELAPEAFRAYRELRGNPKYLAYLMALTPLSAICRMPLGSRPAARSDADSAPLTLERLRAIPLNMAANVAYLQMPAWYGTGRALAAEIGAHGPLRIRQAYREERGVRLSLDRAARALAHTDFGYVRERIIPAGAEEVRHVAALLEHEAERLRADLLILGVKIPSTRAAYPVVQALKGLQLELLHRDQSGYMDFRELEYLVIAATVAAIGMSG